MSTFGFTRDTNTGLLVKVLCLLDPPYRPLLYTAVYWDVKYLRFSCRQMLSCYVCLASRNVNCQKKISWWPGCNLWTNDIEFLCMIAKYKVFLTLWIEPILISDNGPIDQLSNLGPIYSILCSFSFLILVLSQVVILN